MQSYCFSKTRQIINNSIWEAAKQEYGSIKSPECHLELFATRNNEAKNLSLMSLDLPMEIIQANCLSGFGCFVDSTFLLYYICCVVSNLTLSWE